MSDKTASEQDLISRPPAHKQMARIIVQDLKASKNGKVQGRPEFEMFRGRQETTIAGMLEGLFSPMGQDDFIYKRVTDQFKTDANGLLSLKKRKGARR